MINYLMIPLGLLLLIGSATAQLKFGPGPSAIGNRLDTIIAVVNDDVITRTELDRGLTEVQREIRASNTAVPPPEVLERQVLERLIMEKLQLQAAENSGIVVDDPTLNAAVESVAQRNNVSLSQLRQMLERDGISWEQYRDEIRDQVLANRLRQRAVDSRVTIAEQEVDIAMLQLGTQQSESEYRISQILIALPEGATPEQVEQAREKAVQVLAELRQGADFERLAVAISDGREALQGGEIGWRTSTQMPTIFAAPVLQLRPGQVTDVIRSPSGFHIIKLLDVRGSGPAQAGSDQREIVRQALLRRKIEEEWELWLRRLRDESYVDIRL